jgi:hypothetical protein
MNLAFGILAESVRPASPSPLKGGWRRSRRVGSLRQCSTFLGAELGMKDPTRFLRFAQSATSPQGGGELWRTSSSPRLLSHLAIVKDREAGRLAVPSYYLVRGAASAPRSVSVPKLASHNARSMYIPWTRRRGFSASCAICPWSFRCKLIACSFQPGHAAAGRRPVSGPRVPGYHTRAGGHRRSPRSRFQNPVPQERWEGLCGKCLGVGKNWG